MPDDIIKEEVINNVLFIVMKTYVVALSLVCTV